MLLGLVLFYVGAVLILNGLWMLERISDREIWVINLFVGVLSLLAAFRQAFGADADAASVKAAALSLLFSLTYLWLAANRFSGVDGRGLGWFSLFVTITAVPVAADTLRGAQNTGDVWLGLSWAAWAVKATMGVSMPAARTRRVTSRPSSAGMRRSMNTTW